MSDKAIWRTAAWMTAMILTLTYALFVPVDIPPGGPLFTTGYKIGFFGGVVVFAFVPSWLTRFIENRLKRRTRTPAESV